jgi:hypothetical protein
LLSKRSQAQKPDYKIALKFSTRQNISDRQ